MDQWRHLQREWGNSDQRRALKIQKGHQKTRRDTYSGLYLSIYVIKPNPARETVPLKFYMRQNFFVLSGGERKKVLPRANKGRTWGQQVDPACAAAAGGAYLSPCNTSNFKPRIIIAKPNACWILCFTRKRKKHAIVKTKSVLMEHK